MFMSLHERKSVFVLSFIKMYSLPAKLLAVDAWRYLRSVTKQADWYDFALIYICTNVSLIYNKRALFFYEMRSQCLIWFTMTETLFQSFGFLLFQQGNMWYTTLIYVWIFKIKGHIWFLWHRGHSFSRFPPLLCDTAFLEKCKRISSYTLQFHFQR